MRSRATANGVELKVERLSANGFNGWVSYAWNKAELDDPRGAGQQDAHFFADYDQRHTVNTYVAYRWSGRTSLSARFRYGSNFPIRGYIGSNAAGFVLSDQRNGLRLPGVLASRPARRSHVHLSQEPADAVPGSGQRDQSRQLPPERARA